MTSQDFITFIETHRQWAALIIGLTVFGESLAVFGLFVPATALLIGAGTLIGTGTLPLVDVIIAGIIGATIGDAFSFWAGQWLGPRAHKIWPFHSRPGLLEKGIDAFQKHGLLAVFVGRFLGPLRATVPLAAGIMQMPQLTFQIANFLSACIWVPAIFLPGAVLGYSVKSFDLTHYLPWIIMAGFVLGAAVFVIGWWKNR